MRRALERETQTWEANHAGARSQLPAEYDAAVDTLAAQPFLGVRMRTGSRHLRKLLLRRTGFFVLYRVKPRARVIEIYALYARASLAHRR